MQTLQQKLRMARINEDGDSIKRIKYEMGILTRNITTTTVFNKRGDVLSVKQDYIVSDIQKDTIEKEVII